VVEEGIEAEVRQDFGQKVPMIGYFSFLGYFGAFFAFFNDFWAFFRVFWRFLIIFEHFWGISGTEDRIQETEVRIRNIHRKERKDQESEKYFTMKKRRA